MIFNISLSALSLCLVHYHHHQSHHYHDYYDHHHHLLHRYPHYLYHYPHRYHHHPDHKIIFKALVACLWSFDGFADGNFLLEDLIHPISKLNYHLYYAFANV